MTVPSKETAKFVFEGTVKRIKHANLKAITDRDRTAVVGVKKVLRSTRSLASFAGQDITIQLAKGERLRGGQEAVFYTNAWIYAENLAVKSLGHEPSKGGARATAASGPLMPDPVRAAARQQIHDRAIKAAVVISGKIVAVGLPRPPVAAGRAARRQAKPPSISEHDPFWREAVVEVHNVHKGTIGKKQVVVRFPSSNDVRWHHAPKFHTGQQGVFSLRADEISGHKALGAVAASLKADAGAFTCLHPSDFQPADREAEAAIAIAAATSKK